MTPDSPDFRMVCRTFTCGRFLGFLYWNMQYHIEHHTYPAVPFYNLPAIRKAEPPLSPAFRWGGCGRDEKANPYQLTAHSSRSFLRPVHAHLTHGPSLGDGGGKASFGNRFHTFFDKANILLIRAA